MMELTTEYLIIIAKETAEAFYTFCDSTKLFTEKLLQSHTDITIEKKTIKFKNEIEFKFDLKFGNIEGKEQRFFYLKITFNGNEDQIIEYSNLLRIIRASIYRANGQLETLQDDLSSYYANKAYPLIHKVENLLRKLITYFMLTNVGKEWVVQASPSSVKVAIDHSKRKEYVDVLHQVDFIHLGDFLFKPYQTREITELYILLDEAQSATDLNLDELKEFKAKSNWQRYFSKVVNCDDTFLKKRWDELYDLRCIVAHNALTTKNHFDKILTLVDEISPKLNEAIENLDKIHVPIEDKEIVAENVASNVSALFGQFIQEWKVLEYTLHKLVEEIVGPTGFKESRTHILLLHENQVIDDEQYNELLELRRFRNFIVHGNNTEISEQFIKLQITRIQNFNNSFNRTWKEEIIYALALLGGKAELQEIYNFIENSSNKKLSESWKSTVRNTLQAFSSDTESYKGGEDLFMRLDRGYWGLRDDWDAKQIFELGNRDAKVLSKVPRTNLWDG